ncbi:MAG: hypothetical protein D6681_06770 [Calditrichaeota bacterium]|nr:MAG: hypothetical protein D6681_06770 [Calditrichota bacterium]
MSEENVSAFGWNELEFLSWKEFRSMAPAIITLEINRIGRLLDTYSPELKVHNALVKGRYEMKQFVEKLERVEGPPLPPDFAAHLQAAILALSFSAHHLPETFQQELAYILDRLNYIFRRIDLIY